MPGQCHQVFILAHDLLLKLVIKQPPVIDTVALAQQCTELLLKHRTTEVGQFS
jgi:hypothetical protein